MTDYRAIWDGLSQKQQDTLCSAGGSYGFKIQTPVPNPAFVFSSHDMYLELVEMGLLEITTRNDRFVIYTLTDQGAEVLKAMPDDLQRHVSEHPLGSNFWPLPRHIDAMKERLKLRNIKKSWKR